MKPTSTYYVVVTSTPSSLPAAQPALLSLCRQQGVDVRVYWFLPWFSEREHSVYPMHAPGWTKNVEELKVIRVQDDGPGCAVSYALDRAEIGQEDFVVYAHDDMVYGQNCLSKLAAAISMAANQDVGVGFRGSWFRWVPCQYGKTPANASSAWLNQVSYLHGSHLVALRRRTFPGSREEWYSHLRAYPRFRYQPDAMLAAYAYRQNVPLFVIRGGDQEEIRPSDGAPDETRAPRKEWVMWFAVPLGLLPVPWFEVVVVGLLIVLAAVVVVTARWRTRVSQTSP